MDKYFSGEKLYGDDFTDEQIKKWYKMEEEGYSSLPEASRSYEFFALNQIHGFNFIPENKKLGNVLGFGSAYGDELYPVKDRAKKIFILEPSMKLRAKSLHGKKLFYKSPSYTGNIPFKKDFFDLITCFGVIHHIPNVSKVFSEFSRVLKTGGIILLREPIVSMGDWRKPRKGLTMNERGIPLEILLDIAKKNKFQVISKRKVLFPIIRRLNFFGKYGCNSKMLVWSDYLLSKLFFWNNRYHSINFFHKLRPQSVFLVLKKQE